MTGIAAADFFTVHTATFRTLYVFLVLSLDRRRIVHLNITSRPTAVWTSLQLVQAFPFESAPQYLIRDLDGVYGQTVVDAMESMGIEQIVTAVPTEYSARLVPVAATAIYFTNTILFVSV